MSYYDMPPTRRRSVPCAALLLIGLASCLLLAAGFGIGWLVFQRQPAANTAETPPPAPTLTAPTALPTATPAAQAVSTPAPTSPVSATLAAPDLATLQALALELVNQDRAAAGLAPVQWDATAARLAQAHAEDMLAGPFFSHWNRDGYGPDHRAALLAGSSDAIFENIHAYAVRFDDGRPAPIEDWPQRVREAQAGWMQSPGHRDNILDPAHTHVGIGIAYRPDIGELRLVQEFVNHYVELSPLPADSPMGADVAISGRLLNGASDPLINLAYEPLPQPLTLDDLAQTSVYASAAQPVAAPLVQVDDDAFRATVTLDHEGQPGLYHVRIFVTVAGQQVLAATPIVVVR